MRTRKQESYGGGAAAQPDADGGTACLASSRGRGHRAARRRRIASRYKLAHTCTSRDQQDTAFVSAEQSTITAGSDGVYARGLRNQWDPKGSPGFYVIQVSGWVPGRRRGGPA